MSRWKPPRSRSPRKMSAVLASHGDGNGAEVHDNHQTPCEDERTKYQSAKPDKNRTVRSLAKEDAENAEQQPQQRGRGKALAGLRNDAIWRGGGRLRDGHDASALGAIPLLSGGGGDRLEDFPARGALCLHGLRILHGASFRFVVAPLLYNGDGCVFKQNAGAPDSCQDNKKPPSCRLRLEGE